MTSNEDSRKGSDFAVLARRIRDAGLLDRRPGYYVLRGGLVVGAYAASWWLAVLAGDSWWQLGVAAVLAVVYAQVALLAHDVAHRQVFRRRRPSAVAGRVLGNVGIGMGYGWWMDKHTRHHAHPNHEELDPDVDPDIFVWSTAQARASSGLPRFVGRWQAFLFFPLLTLEGFNLHYAGIRAALRPSSRHRVLESGLLIAHVVGYLVAVFTIMPVGLAVAFVLVHQMLWGLYMGSTFAPSHKGMPAGVADDDFLRRQVLTSRDIDGGPLIDVVYGGLNHQIEHHLFPSMPSPHLRRARPIVEAYCAELDVPHVSTGLVESYACALRSLHQAGAPLREERPGSRAGA